jgi:hypothetical protein
MMMKIFIWHQALHDAVTLNMDAAAWAEVQKQMTATNAKLDAFARILDQLRADLNAIRDSNLSSSNSDRRIPCPLDCGADFKKVCEFRGCCILEASPHHVHR